MPYAEGREIGRNIIQVLLGSVNTNNVHLVCVVLVLDEIFIVPVAQPFARRHLLVRAVVGAGRAGRCRPLAATFTVAFEAVNDAAGDSIFRSFFLA